ncbi:pyrroline-5-carboxylate reductase 3 [Pieris napi]|uniref:pyrroline-5-carboxylate reductase 3 n=1 Tax=Pieris napi TaxID=78633 RepID=UPI001FBA60CB|nr:pyrroline-5-carboxylate reductase 3 [Pieris napi]
MSYNLGFIGGGNMSTAIFQGILRNGDHPASKIFVSGPHLENLLHWKELGANITNKNGDIYSTCDMIFLGVKPQFLSNAISDCYNTLPPNMPAKKVLFVSILAGTNIEQLHKALSILPGEKQVIRTLPNTPMAVSAGACLYTPDNTVTEEQCRKVEIILSGCGVCERVAENLIASLGSLIGCGPAFMYIAIEALADGTVKQGAPRALAMRLAAQMVMGSGKMVLGNTKHPGLLKDEVCSPGGSTICGVTALEQGKFRATLINAIEAAVLRTKEMEKK